MPTSRPPYQAAFRQQMVEHPCASYRNDTSAARSACSVRLASWCRLHPSIDGLPRHARPQRLSQSRCA